MKSQMDSRFSHKKLEEKIYKKWEESGFFNPDNLIKEGIVKKNAKPFTIVLPPPNVTGILHMGSALMLVLEDIMIRFARMQGKKTLWLPGTDHAAIATEAAVIKKLAKENKSKHDLGRNIFLKHVDRYAMDSKSTIINQAKAMGASLDWSREAFTLDDERSLAVKTAFEKMHNEGLIYRGNRIVNWDPKGQTTISDDEVEHEKIKGKLYTFKYSKNIPISIATTRPETKLGDTAIAVHPDDKRYKKYVGKIFNAKFAGEEINLKVVTDKEIDPKFGTGALGVTPAHSMNDFEIAQRHNLPSVQVINEYAKMMVGMSGVKGEKTTVAREAVVGWLESEGLLEKIEEIEQNISVSERTGAIIEPLPKLQWFIDVNKKFKIPYSNIKGIKSGQEVTLKKLMITAVKSGQIEILPDRFKKVYFHWAYNLRDWCISRQIWYGHRIPVWYRTTDINSEQDEIYVGTEAPKNYSPNPTGTLKGKWEQDPDTLDTWFSSALWTFSTLGWPTAVKTKAGKPQKTGDLAEFHPTSVLETGYDILFFWVARMVLMSTYLLGEVPFEKVYLHGLVRDEKNRKISKSLGNNIDPLDMIKEYGADAVRMALFMGTSPGSDSKISIDKIRGYRNFTTKIWNASRFVLINYDEELKAKPAYTKTDKANLAQLEEVKKSVTDDLENFKFHRAGDTLYHYFWHTFADKIIEDSKKRLYNDSPAQKKAAQETLMKILKESLTMLHPFVPYVTEEVWARLPKGKNDRELLMVQKW